MDPKDNLLGVLKTLFKWKKPIIITCFIAGVGSIVISLLMSNYYSSSTTFYAASPDLAKPEPVGNPLKEREYFGREEDLDRLLAIAESNEVVSHLIERFGLYEHYDINPQAEKAAHKVQLKFRKLYNVKKTKYEGIELSVEDKEKQLAAEIVNAARHKVDEIAQRLVKESQRIQIKAFESDIVQKEEDLLILGDSLAKMRDKYGIYNTLSQGETLASLLARTKSKLARNRARLTVLKQSSQVPRDSILLLSAEVKGNEAEVADISSRVKLFGAGLARVEVLEDLMEEAGDQISLIRERYKQLKVAFENKVPAIITLEEGKVPLVKSRPRRSIIVIASVLAALLMSIIAVLLLETYKEVNWKDIIYG